MLRNTQYYELPKTTQYAINEYELQILKLTLRHVLHLNRHQARDALIKSLAPNGFLFHYELDEFLIDGKRRTKQQHMAYLHLKGYGINKISALLGMNQPQIVAFKDNPTYEMFPLHLPMMWQTTPDIEMNHQNMVKHFAIHPNICGGFTT